MIEFQTYIISTSIYSPVSTILINVSSFLPSSQTAFVSGTSPLIHCLSIPFPVTPHVLLNFYWYGLFILFEAYRSSLYAKRYNKKKIITCFIMIFKSYFCFISLIEFYNQSSLNIWGEKHEYWKYHGYWKHMFYYG